MGVEAGAHVWSQKKAPNVLCYPFLPYSLEAVSLNETERQHGLVCPLPPPPIMPESLSVAFCHGCYGFELMASCLHSKHGATPRPPAPDDAFDNTKENVFLSFLLSHDPRAILELTFKRISFKPCPKIHNIMDISIL